MNTHVWSARAVHNELAMMAWEELNRKPPETADTVTLLQLHLNKMAEILADPEKYRRLFQRLRRGAA